MDYLPIQATSVPCERVFSSAKETDTAKRNRMKAMTMETLQLLKFLLKKERLNFMVGWATSESDMGAEPRLAQDPLDAIFKGDADAVMDQILKECSTYDD
jgi:hypothetical protein